MVVISKGKYEYTDIDDIENKSFPCIEISGFGIRFYRYNSQELFYYSFAHKNLSIKLGYLGGIPISNHNLLDLFREIDESWKKGYNQELFDMYIEQLESISSAYDGFYEIVKAELNNVVDCYFNKNCKK